jgi:hypothetical protein
MNLWMLNENDILMLYRWLEASGVIRAGCTSARILALASSLQKAEKM